MHLPRQDCEVEPVDRAHAAEVKMDLLERQRTGIFVLCEEAAEQLRSRNDRAIGLQRPAVLEIKQVGNPARNH